MDSPNNNFHSEFSVEEMEALNFLLEMPSTQEFPLNVEDYLNDEDTIQAGVAIDEDKKEVMAEPTMAVEEDCASTKEEGTIVAQHFQSTDVEEKATQEAAAAAAETSHVIAEERLVAIEPEDKGELSDTNDVSETKGKEIIIYQPPQQYKQGETSGVVNEHMALAIVEPQLTVQTPAPRRVSVLPFHQRLQGWRIREVPRRDLIRVDKFYVHLESRVQFRSLNEVDDFLNYGFHPKRQIYKKLAPTTQGPSLNLSPSPGPNPIKQKRQYTRRKMEWEFYNKRKPESYEYEICDIRYKNNNPEADYYLKACESRSSTERTDDIALALQADSFYINFRNKQHLEHKEEAQNASSRSSEATLSASPPCPLTRRYNQTDQEASSSSKKRRLD